MPKRSRKQIKLEDTQRKRQHLDEQLVGNWDAFDGEEDLGLEDVPRRFKVEDEEEHQGLPVIRDGKVERVRKELVKKPSMEEESSSEEEQDEEEEWGGVEDSEVAKMEQEATEANEPELSDDQVKEMVADYAGLINESPEEHLGKIRELQRLAARSRRARTRQLIMLALLTIYKDVIPGYRIKPLTDAQKKEKATKEVRQLREFEQLLVSLYKEYLDLVRLFFNQGRLETQGKRYALASTAVRIAADLLESVPQFNFRSELMKVLVEKLSSQRIDQPFQKALDCVITIFETDVEGHVSFELVQALAKMIKTRRYKVDSKVLASLVHLRLLTELTGRADLERMIKEKPKENLIKKKDRVHLSKKQRKQRKEQKEIDEEMRKAELSVSSQMREKLQAQSLKVVFVLYFNILKVRSKTLLGAALEGLAKYAHLINADLFGDLLEVLREIITEQDIVNPRQILLCVCTAFALLSGQVGDSINLDLSFFINKLYDILPTMALDPLIEQNHKHLASSHRGRLTSETDMLVRALESLFSKQSMSTRPRVLAFSKRLATCALFFPERTALVAETVLERMVQRYPYSAALYQTTDRIGRGSYNENAEIPERSNAEVATMWEFALLDKHYSPKVRENARQLARTKE